MAHVILVSAQVLLVLTLGLWTRTSDLGLTITGHLCQLRNPSFSIYLDRKVVGDDHIEQRVVHLLQHKAWVVGQLIDNKVIQV